MADRLKAHRMVSIREFSRRPSVVSELRLPCKILGLFSRSKTTFDQFCVVAGRDCLALSVDDSLAAS